jgi:hypothetical protein
MNNETKKPSRRIKRFVFSPEALAHGLRHGMHCHIIKGIPHEGEVRGTGFDHTADCFNVFIEHESFPEVPVGSAPESEYIIVHTTQGFGEPFYKGRGEHSVHALEQMVEEFKELCYQKQIKIQQLQETINREGPNV